MTRDEAVTRIQNTLGFRTDQTSNIQTALKDAQVKLEQGAELPWFLLTEISTSTSTPDEERVSLPTDFLREYEEDPLWYVDSAGAWHVLAKDDLETLRADYAGAGAPIAYALDPKYFRLFPTPDDNYTLKFIYYATDTVLTTDVENNWLKYFPYLMIGEAGRLFAPGLRDAAAVKQFQQWALEGRREMTVANEARMHSSRRYIMGGPD